MSQGEDSTERQFDPTAIEPKWQRQWDDRDVFQIDDDAEDPIYVLAMFPYPSGEMHMGHARNYALTDAYARYKRMQGEDVLHPMGWDSFGLPAENAANQRGVDPREWTMDCIENMKGQMDLLGFGFDWDREIATCEPEYFQWNQWFFKRFYEGGLVERQATELNWCPDCETVLANEQVHGENEECWRCDTPIEHRERDQWFLTTTDYADELADSLAEMDGWPDNVREMQRNWIGKQEGAAVSFDLTTDDSVEIFTTRLDTIYGATFFALSPGHDVAQQIAADNDEVAEYIERVQQVDEDEIDETSGVFTGEYATNPATGEEIPVYVADYVLEDIGTGALYAVPAHDERDHAFATEHDLPVKQVIEPAETAEADEIDVQETAYTEDGVLVNSGPHDGLTSSEAREQFVETFDGEFRTAHSLQDWCISRQRYWGTPIPFVECPDCGFVPVPDEELPVELPEFVQTTGNPLDAAQEWKETSCPDCDQDAQRVTDTMDTFFGSSWYFLRFISPDLEDAPFETSRANDWMPVDQYIGGIEHATMHLIYSRFFTKVLDDLNLIDGVREPFENLLTQGMVRKDGEAMSSSSGNVVPPEPYVQEYGADTGRLFTLDAAQPAKDFDWTEEGSESAHDFLQNVYGLVAAYVDGDIETVDGETDETDEYVSTETDATAAIATREFESLRFNHALQSVRELVSLLRRYTDHTEPDEQVFEQALSAVSRMLAPVTPHISEELWEMLGNDSLAATAQWPDVPMPDGYETASLLVENTREDIRDILGVADIEDPEQIEIAVAPEWKHYARTQAQQLEDNVVGQLMSDDRIQQHGEAAAEYAKELAGTGHLDEQLPPEREFETLSQARWLIEDEFDTTVLIHSAEDAPEELTEKATPGRPGIRIEE